METLCISQLCENRSKQKELNIFATPFNVEPADMPDELQLELIQLQCDDELKARYSTATYRCLNSIGVT